MGAKKGWFGPRSGASTGYHGMWLGDVAPVTWQGWLATVIYILLQIGVAGALLQLRKVLLPEVLATVIMVQLILMHLVYLWFAARHCTTSGDCDPQTLPSELRKWGR